MSVSTETELALLQGAFSLLGEVIKGIEHAKAGKIDPNAVLASMSAFQSLIAADNAEIDKAAAEKFGTDGNTGG